MRGRGKAAVLLGCVALMGGLVGACGDDSDSGGGGGSTSSDSGGESANAKVIDPASMDGAKGEITYCQGKDTAGNAKALIEGFNQKFQSQGITAKLVEFPADAGQQRAQFVQRQEAKSGECDVFSSDVIWTAEFASQGWIYDMTPYVESKKSDFIPAVLETATYNDKIWAVPNTSDAAFIYYHTDKVKDDPADLAGRLLGGRAERRHRLSGRRLRGPDLRLPRDRVRRGRLGHLRRRQEVDVQLA